MRKKKIESVYTVVDLGTRKEFQLKMDATGQEAVKYLRENYRRSKFILDGFIIDEEFKPLF